MTPLKTEANPNIQVGPLRWGRPPAKATVKKHATKFVPWEDCHMAPFDKMLPLMMPA